MKIQSVVDISCVISSCVFIRFISKPQPVYSTALSTRYIHVHIIHKKPLQPMDWVQGINVQCVCTKGEPGGGATWAFYHKWSSSWPSARMHRRVTVFVLCVSMYMYVCASVTTLASTLFVSALQVRYVWLSFSLFSTRGFFYNTLCSKVMA